MLCNWEKAFGWSSHDIFTFGWPYGERIGKEMQTLMLHLVSLVYVLLLYEV